MHCVTDWWNVSYILTLIFFSSDFKHENHFSQLAQLILDKKGEKGYSHSVTMTGQQKTKAERKKKQFKYNTVLLTNWTEEKKKEKKNPNSINIYGTHLWHKYAAVSLANFCSFFFLFPNQITMETVQKGREWGRTLSIER